MTGRGLSGWAPFSEDDHAAQLDELARLVRALPRPACVLDLGAGDGRLAKPLRDMGCDVTAVDDDEEAVCALTDADLRAHQWDFASAGNAPFEGEVFDLVLCMGNTFCLVHDVAVAVDLLSRIRGWLSPGGLFVIDDILTETWRDVASGNWQEGADESGEMQLVWAEGDAVVALREGDAVDEESWTITDRDTPMRLWTLGSLRLLARAAGMGRPRTGDGSSLILFSCKGDAPHAD